MGGIKQINFSWQKLKSIIIINSMKKNNKKNSAAIILPTILNYLETNTHSSLFFSLSFLFSLLFFFFFFSFPSPKMSVFLGKYQMLETLGAGSQGKWVYSDFSSYCCCTCFLPKIRVLLCVCVFCGFMSFPKSQKSFEYGKWSNGSHKANWKIDVPRTRVAKRVKRDILHKHCTFTPPFLLFFSFLLFFQHQISLTVLHIEALSRLDHHNIVGLYEYNLEAEYPYRSGSRPVIALVIELATGGELFDFMMFTGYVAFLFSLHFLPNWEIHLMFGYSSCFPENIARSKLSKIHYLLLSCFNA